MNFTICKIYFNSRTYTNAELYYWSASWSVWGKSTDVCGLHRNISKCTRGWWIYYKMNEYRKRLIVESRWWTYEDSFYTFPAFFYIWNFCNKMLGKVGKYGGNKVGKNVVTGAASEQLMDLLYPSLYFRCLKFSTI